MLTRRRLLINGGLTGLVLAGSRLDAFALQEDLWATAATILTRIKAPVFPARDVPIAAACLINRRNRRPGDGFVFLQRKNFS